jgi:hypothetical protein
MPIVAPFNPSADIIPSAPGTVDVGSQVPGFPYRAAFLTDKLAITEEDASALYATWGEGGFHIVGRNDGGNQFNGYGIISAYDGNEPYLLITRTNSADLSATTPVVQGNNLLTIAPTGADGADYVGNGGILVVVDDAVAVGDVPFKIVLQTGKGIYAFNVELTLRSAGILQFDSFSLLNTPEKASRQYISPDLTSNATPSAGTVITLEDETMYQFRTVVKGRFRSVGTDKGVIGFLEFGAYRNNGGAATLIGTTFKALEDLGASGYDFNATVSGNNVLIEVTGAVGETVDWSTDTVWSGAGN